MISKKEGHRLIEFIRTNGYQYGNLEGNTFLYKIIYCSEKVSLESCPVGLMDQINSFVDSGVFEKVDSLIYSKVKVIPFKDCWFFADSPTLSSTTEIMKELYISNNDGYYSYIGGDGQILASYLFSKFSKRRFLKGLDLFSGSGLIGLSLSRFVESYSAVEIDSRAYKWGKFNKKINQISNYTPYIGNMYDPVLDETPFDVITANPPYSIFPTEFSEKNNIPGNEMAGDYGIEFTIKIMDGLENSLSDNGIAFICTNIPFINKKNYLKNRMEELYYKNDYEINIIYFTKNRLKDYFDEFYNELGINKLCFSVIVVSKGKKFKINENQKLHYYLSNLSFLNNFKISRKIYRKIWV